MVRRKKMSLEIRWFFDKTLTKEITEWGIANGLIKEEEHTDIYILFPTSELGVKFSRGKLEIKYLKSADRFNLANNQVSGWAEIWMKSSVPLVIKQEMPFQNINILQHKVRKVRYTRRFELDPESKTLNPVDKKIDQGIKMEITKLIIETKKWWTLGIEAFGDNLIDILEFGILNLMENAPIEKLKIEHSYSYPKWLQIIENE